MSSRGLYDVVIVGGGPAGSAAAITLARAGCRVLLAEAVSQVPFKIGESLPPSAYPLLRDLGVAARVAEAGHLPCPGIVTAWGGDRLEERDFIRELHGSGLHLDRPRFDADLRAAAAEAGAEVRLGCSFSRLQRSSPAGPWQLVFAGPGEASEVRAPWVIDATGRRALIASQSGAMGNDDDALVALCTVVDAQAGGGDARTFIEAAQDGWWYSALLPTGNRLLAFFTDADLPAASTLSEPEAFTRALIDTRYICNSGGVLDGARLGRVRRFPACSVSRHAFGGSGWLAVGDATLAFDPLSSQGMFHALYTGLRCAQTVLAALGGDIAALPAWTERMLAVHAAYRRHLASCYATETRWAEAPFWRRRHAFARGSLSLAHAQPASAS